MKWNVYLSGEIHTDWRQQLIDGAAMAWTTTPAQVVEILAYVKRAR